MPEFPRPGNFIVFYPSAGLVIVEVHKLAGRLQTSRDLIGFSLSDVDKVLSKSASSEISKDSSWSCWQAREGF